MFEAISAILIVLFFIVMAILVNPHIKTGAARLRPRRRADDDDDDDEIGVSLDRNRIDDTFLHYDPIDQKFDFD